MGPNDPIIGTHAHAPYMGGLDLGAVTSIHHRNSVVVGVQYLNDTMLCEVEQHLVSGSAEEANAHLLEARKKTPKPPPKKTPADLRPKANRLTNPQENKKTTPEENKKTNPEAYTPTNPTPALWDPKGGHKWSKNRHIKPNGFTKGMRAPMIQ